MRKFLFIMFIFAEFSANAQSRSNLFLSADFSSGIGLSGVYNYLPFLNAGVGPAFEIVNFSKGGTIESALLLDLRYYFKIKNSTFLPLAQVGKNFYRSAPNNPASPIQTSVRGGLQKAFGLGYLYKFNEHIGMYIAIKLRSITYHEKNNNSSFNFNSGWNFVYSPGIQIVL